MSLEAAGAGEHSPLGHVPSQPGWNCRACGLAWPCGPARESLIAEYEGNTTALSLYLAACLHEAIDDLRELDVRSTGGCGGVFDRFLGWIDQQPKPDQMPPHEPRVGP
ncbi:hypothetical protein D0Q02_28145 [Micromonospora craniellae]|uniref:Flavin reductase n=1 Tax=Micromonospora craniellae TaxID=2294034 RepID=A0A372FS91_9ACTN|nr:hypothetical protein D0Q02_28145 [Micromonospora craniellae]